MRLSTTSALAAVTAALCLGFAAGWWYRGPLPADTQPISTSVINQPSSRSTPPAPQYPATPEAETVEQATSDGQTLEKLLNAHRFQEATALYYEAISRDATQAPLLRPTVDDYLKRCLANCDSEVFLALVESWLGTFYDDIPVLLLLAGHQENQGQPEAAANTLLLARTYALAVNDQQAVNKSLGQLSQRTDQRLSREQRWIELLGYYEYLAAIDFSRPEFELRRALLYRHLGEQARGSALLASLQAADNGSNPQWTATLEQHLAEATTEIAPGTEPSSAIALERRGDGYLVDVTLNDRTSMKLLIDTGASITALSQESFRRLQRHRVSLLGTRLFNTANGYTRGDIYRAAALTLGQERIEDINIAVLDLRTMDDIDGLLGMNVLRQFHFEIDQSAGAMRISRR